MRLGVKKQHDWNLNSKNKTVEASNKNGPDWSDELCAEEECKKVHSFPVSDQYAVKTGAGCERRRSECLFD